MRVAHLIAAALALHPAPASAPERAVSLLANNEVVELSLPGGRMLFRRRVGPKPAVAAMQAGRMLARSDRRIFVLVSSAPNPDSVAVLSARSGAILARWRLEPGVRYRGLVFASDRVFAYGGRLGREVDRTNHEREQSAVVTQLDSANGAIVNTTEIRPAEQHSWWVYWGSADATRIALSYHGGCFPEVVGLCTSGADVVDIGGAQLQRCERQSSRPNLGCLEEAHGMIEPYGVGWIATTGGEELVQYGRDGRALRRLHSGIRKDHLMDFAFTRDRDGVLVIGSCYGHEGLRRISLRTGRSALVRARLCGESVASGRRALVVRKSESIQICAPATARACRTRRLGAEIVDLMVVD